MNTLELKWIMDNRHLLNEEDYKQLELFNLFYQFDNEQLETDPLKTLEPSSLVKYLYKKYN